MSKKTSIVLGGTNPHIELIKQLKERSYYTILVDYLDNPPAKSYADFHIQESTLDKEAVLRIARENSAALVISACIDHANASAVYVGEQLGLPVPYSYETALLVTDKEKMKSQLSQNGIPTAKHFVTDDLMTMDKGYLKWPMVVKPIDCNSSKGVRVAHDSSELKDYFSEARQLSRSQRVIIEEFVTGQEVSVDCYVKNGIAKVVMLRKKFNGESGKRRVIHNFGSIAPMIVSADLWRVLENTANHIAQTFGLQNTSLLIQVLIDKEQVSVIEFAARVGGGMSYRTVKLVTDFDIVAATISSYLGEDVSLQIKKTDVHCLAIHLFAEPCILGGIRGINELVSEGMIRDFRMNKTIGAEINADRSSSQRVCGFIIQATSLIEARDRLIQVMNRIDVLDVDGKSVLAKDDLLDSVVPGLDEEILSD